MKKKTAFLSLLLGLTTAGSAFALGATVNASDDVIYGTMDIPYSVFYSSEGIDGVDAVSSATTSKWKSTNLVNGTYSEENEDGTGTILGVKYYVALTEDTLAQLGDNNYNFTRIDTVPAAYKNVTVEDGNAVFSAVVGETETLTDKEVTISSDSVWGDYLIDVVAINNAQGTSDIGTIYGVVLKTTDGQEYAMRHLQNIWRDEIAWSSGFITSEPHGNTLDYEDYVTLMGKTIDTITYITETGYHTIDTDLYVPVKFDGTVGVINADVTSSSTTFSTVGFPEDYDKEYSVNAEGFTVTDGTISFENVLPGSYTLTVKDANGVYANAKASFILSTDNIPAEFSGAQISKTADATEEEYENFLRNIATVSVDGTDYAASGKRSIKIIKDDGTIDFEAKSGDTEIFAEDKEYAITVTATGYNRALEFTLVKSSAPIDVESSPEPSASASDPDTSDVSDASDVSDTSDNSDTSGNNGSNNGAAQQSSNTGTTVGATTNTGSNNGTNNNTTVTGANNTVNATTTTTTTTADAPVTGSSETAASAALVVAAASAATAFVLRKRKNEKA